ncbi:hypothetical protein [Streptomyces vietnamensis]|uniref:hypothetical protein n=1 Tax=Streptomyces vietnamensis TaxID=362257 RepID=UPI0006964C46|nr:hypothetical protein [Streptomyces vietnamensis]
MNRDSLWTAGWESAVRAAITQPDTFLTGRADMDAGGIGNLQIAPGRLTALITGRNSRAELRAAITLPVIPADQAAILDTASPRCPNHHGADSTDLSQCLADPAHTGGVSLLPVADELRFICTCGMPPCRHIAALAHAFTDRLRTHPGDLAILRGLREPQHDALAPSTNVTTTKNHIAAHHAWVWHRERPDQPSVPDLSPTIPDQPPAPPAWSPPPIPSRDHLPALVADAAAQAAGLLLSGRPLECAWDDDAVRLASRIPHVRLPDIADRLGLDIAQLRERLTRTRSAAARDPSLHARGGGTDTHHR